MGSPCPLSPIIQLPYVKMFWRIVACILFSVLVQAAPTAAPAEKLGLNIEKRGSLPTLTLSDATYVADSYNSQSDVRWSDYFIRTMKFRSTDPIA